MRHCKNLDTEEQSKKNYTKTKLHDRHSHLFKILFTSLTSFIIIVSQPNLRFHCGFRIVHIIDYPSGFIITGLKTVLRAWSSSLVAAWLIFYSLVS